MKFIKEYFKKTWPYFTAISLLMFLAISIVIGIDIVHQQADDISYLDDVVGTVCGIDVTYRLAMFIYGWSLFLFCIHYGFFSLLSLLASKCDKVFKELKEKDKK